MVIEYKGYKADLKFVHEKNMDVMRGSAGHIELRSDILNATSARDIYYPEDTETIYNIYIQLFKDKVNTLLGGEME